MSLQLHYTPRSRAAKAIRPPTPVPDASCCARLSIGRMDAVQKEHAKDDLVQDLPSLRWRPRARVRPAWGVHLLHAVRRHTQRQRTTCPHRRAGEALVLQPGPRSYSWLGTTAHAGSAGEAGGVMKTRKASVVVISSCTWCCGDLVLLGPPAGPRVVCADCGQPASEVGAPRAGSVAYESRRRSLSLGKTIPVHSAPLAYPKSA